MQTPSSWPGGIAAITLLADDLTAARRFYTQVFGLPVHYEDDNSASFMDPAGHIREIAH